MRPNESTDITHQGTIDPGSRVDFGLDQSSLVHLMSVLTDLYSDPAMAVIREYSTNAFDSHREAGIDDPIEVELPSALNPTFIVRDHGIGMTQEEIETNYGQYGYSSKRETDDQVGMLGLGCKSALTYSSQFTLTAVKDGLRTVVLITRDERGVGCLQTIGQPMPTDEPNGVEVSVPVSDYHTMCQKARQFYSYWEPGTVLVDGEQPDSVFENEDFVVLDPDVLIRKTNYHTDSRIIMGNVPYRFELPYGVLPHGWEVVARVPIGSVSFTPSREDLQMNDLTRDTIDTLVQYVKPTWLRSMQEKVDAMDDPTEAVRFASEHNYAFRHRFTWNGAIIPTQVSVGVGWSWGSRYSDRASSISGAGVRLTQFYDSDLVVVGVKRITGLLKEQTLHYWQDVLGNTGSCSVLFIGENPNPQWITETVEVQTIRDAAPKKQRAKAEKAKYSIVNNWNEVDRRDDLPASATTLVRTPASMDRAYRQDLMVLANQDDGVVLLSIRKNSEKKFLAEHPKSLSIEEYLDRVRKQIESKLTAEMVFYHENPYGYSPSYGWNRAIDHNKVADPELKWLLHLPHVDMPRQFIAYRNVQGWPSVTEITLPDTSHLAARADRIVERYPFIFGHESVPTLWLTNTWYYSRLPVTETSGTDVLDDLFPDTITKENP